MSLLEATRSDTHTDSGLRSNDPKSADHEVGSAGDGFFTLARVYQALAQHQVDETWFGQPAMLELQRWATRFNVEFKLEIPEVSLSIDWLRRRRYGHFRSGHNGFGLRGEIALNIRYLFGQREPWEVLGTLLHELLHAWQQAYGKPGKRNYHNRQFREKAAFYGLLVDKRGVTGYAAESLFKDLLRRYDVNVPFFEVPVAEKRHEGTSKLKKWTCDCFNIWCGRPGLEARCLLCGQKFRPAIERQRED